MKNGFGGGGREKSVFFFLSVIKFLRGRNLLSFFVSLITS